MLFALNKCINSIFRLKRISTTTFNNCSWPGQRLQLTTDINFPESSKKQEWLKVQSELEQIWLKLKWKKEKETEETKMKSICRKYEYKHFVCKRPFLVIVTGNLKKSIESCRK